ncbi:MAG: BTAD domain-containing putative transcriptional regulator [Pseudomonadota bacterium]
MLRIWLFGSLCVANDAGGEQVTAVSGRCGSLLAYLALGRGRYFSRTELLGTLWPERMASMTAGSFNTALWRLRRLVECPPFQHGELIASDRRGAIGLNGSQAVWLDIEEFERRIASGLSRPIELLGEAEIADLRAGVALYKSDILMEFTDDWALREREKHRRHYLNALWRLMQLSTIRREYGEGIRHAQSILDCDTLREDVHRELMQLFVLSGQRAQALRQFETCRDMLRRELAIQPMRETLALYRQIADSAIGGGGDGEPARAMQAPLHFEYVPIAPGRGPMSPPPAAGTRGMIAAARQHLAAADAQLELSLRQLDS